VSCTEPHELSRNAWRLPVNVVHILLLFNQYVELVSLNTCPPIHTYISANIQYFENMQWVIWGNCWTPTFWKNFDYIGFLGPVASKCDPLVCNWYPQ